MFNISSMLGFLKGLGVTERGNLGGGASRQLWLFFSMNFISLNVSLLPLTSFVNKDPNYVFKREANAVIKFRRKIKLFELNEASRSLKRYH